MMDSKTITDLKSKFSAIDDLIAEKIMLVDTKNYHVSMLGELWNSFNDEKKQSMCENILNYCIVQNSFSVGVDSEKRRYEVAENNMKGKTLLISIKDSKDNVAPYAYFKSGTIHLIEDSHVLRNSSGSIKLMIKVLKWFSLPVLLLLILYFIFF